jgi:hypothetical protein
MVAAQIVDLGKGKATGAAIKSLLRPSRFLFIADLCHIREQIQVRGLILRSWDENSIRSN